MSADFLTGNGWDVCDEGGEADRHDSEWGRTLTVDSSFHLSKPKKQKSGQSNINSDRGQKIFCYKILTAMNYKQNLMTM